MTPETIARSLTSDSDCPDCAGDGWVVGIGVELEDRCCGMSDWECGARGCIGPRQEQVQVQIQELCEACEGTGLAVRAVLTNESVNNG